MKITTLGEDMEVPVSGYGKNTLLTSTQLELWPRDVAITRSMLGKDKAGCLRLPIRDGWDGLPIFDKTYNAVRHFFWYNDGKTMWPSDEELIRFSLFFHAVFIRVVAMVIKRQWERYLLKRTADNHADNGAIPRDILKPTDIKDLDEALHNFNLGELGRAADEKELFGLLEKYGGLASKAGYANEQEFETLVHEMIKGKIHLVGTNSLEMTCFIDKQKAERKAFIGASERLKEEYMVQKGHWIFLHNQVEELLLRIDQRRVGNANIEHRWLTLFGKAYLALLEAEQRVVSMQRMLQVKDAKPDLDFDECRELVIRQEKEERERLETLQKEFLFHKGLILPPTREGTPAEISDYRRECKKILRKIWLLTHEERLNLENFTDEQRKKLRTYFDKTLEVDTKTIGYDHRPLEQLLDILSAVRAIWEVMGVDVREEMIVKGEDLAQKIEWLKKQIERLERESGLLRDRLHVLTVNQDIAEKSASMKNDEEIERITGEMESKRKAFEKEAEELKIELERFFNQGGNQ